LLSNRKDLLAGLIFIVVAAFFAFSAQDLDTGTAFRMGPAYFPYVLSGLLAILGLLIIGQGLRHPGTPIGKVPGRGLVLILLAPIVFGLVVRGLGLAPAIAIVALLGAVASRRNTPLGIIGSVVVLTVGCVLIFSYGLGVPVPLVGPWLNPPPPASGG